MSNACTCRNLSSTVDCAERFGGMETNAGYGVKLGGSESQFGFGAVFGNIVAHVFISTVLWHLLRMSVRNFRSPFAWHVILCTIGFIFLLSEALIIYASGSISSVLPSVLETILHVILLRGGIFLSIVGTAIEIEYKTARNKRHFTTYHGKTGIASMVLLCISAFGVIAVMSSDSYFPEYRSLIVFTHSMIVTAGYAIGMVSYVLAYYTGWFNKFASKRTRRCLIAITIAFSSYCAYSSIQNNYREYTAVSGRQYS